MRSANTSKSCKSPRFERQCAAYKSIAGDLQHDISVMGVQRSDPVARMSEAISGTTPSLTRLSKTFPPLTGGVSRPVIGQNPVLHIAMKRRMGPVAHARHKGMLDRIEMNVVNVPREVSFIADGVFPEPPLPKRQIAIRPAL